VLVDPMPRHVEAAAALRDEGLSVTAELGEARRLQFDDASFDAVLMLGPLYHLTDRADRVLAWREAGRVVRPGGPIVAAAISRFASLLDGLARGFLFDPDFRAIVERDLAEGQHRNPQRRPHWFTTAYFHHPAELGAEPVDAGLEIVDVVAVEGVAPMIADLAERWDDPQDRDVILWAARAVEREPALLGASAHLLVVASRPG
jgi:SAM-dependent methyltransferase